MFTTDWVIMVLFDKLLVFLNNVALSLPHAECIQERRFVTVLGAACSYALMYLQYRAAEFSDDLN